MNNLFLSNTIVIGIELTLVTLVYLALIVSLRLLEKRMKVVVTREQMWHRMLSGIKLARDTLSLIFVVTLLAIIGFNAWKMYQGVALRQYTIELLNAISPAFWQTLLKNTGVLIVVIYTARHLVRLIGKGLIKLQTAALHYKSIQSNDISIRMSCGIDHND